MGGSSGRTVLTNAGRGAVMGLADVVPGVSGGTMALLLGIYSRFIGALAHLLDMRIVRYAFGIFSKDGRTRFFEHARETDFWLLVQLGAGIFVGIGAGLMLIVPLIDQFPAGMMALFFGLILASARIPWREIEHRRPGLLVPGAVGVAVAASAAFLPTSATDPALLMIFVAGAVAITAMLLPGISGSALLVLLGVYPAVALSARNTMVVAATGGQLATLAIFAVGALVGILLSSRAIRYALAEHPSVTFAALTGLMVGSVVRVWPWRDEVGFGAGHPVLPDGLVPALLILVGGVSSVLLERLGAQAGKATATEKTQSAP